MARMTAHPKIRVEAVYSGTTDMQELFVSLLVKEARKKSVRTFENIKQPEYNLPIQNNTEGFA